jgi:hypothetical protein
MSPFEGASVLLAANPPVDHKWYIQLAIVVTSSSARSLNGREKAGEESEGGDDSVLTFS